MKTTKSKFKGFLIIHLFFLLPAIFIAGSLIAQSNCAAPKDHGMGFSTSISSVIINDDETYTITLRVKHNGCPGPECNSINHYSVEADPGSYSDISWALIYGNVSYNGIVFGPDLGGWDKQGFRISSITGMGNGKAGIFTVTYTLDYLQDQTVMVKAGSDLMEVFFTEQEFDYVLNCKLGGSYAMPAGGKLTYTSNKIGPELTALSEVYGIPVSNDVYQIVFDEATNSYYVVAEFIPETGQYATLLNELLTNYGLRNVIPDVNQHVITGQIPVSNLVGLNDLASLFSASPVYPVTTNTGLLATSQGDTSMLSFISRDIYTVDLGGDNRRSINGEGVKIGVLSNSYNTKTNPSNRANDDVLKYELPGIGIQSDGTEIPNPYNNTDVQLIKEYPYGEASDEGRAMMQIMHDIAPGADQAFRTGVLGAVDMVTGIDELVAAGCDVIVDDISYISQPFFEDGIIAQKVDEVNSSGISYFTSAGNFGGKSYAAAFNPRETNLPGISGTPHIFGITDGVQDVFQNVTANAGDESNPVQHYTIVLQWEDGSSFNATNTDLDIYLATDVGTYIGYNTINIGNKAIEILPFIVTETTITNIVVVNASENDADINFKYVVFKGQLDINEYSTGNATIVGHANSAGAMTVGAIRYDKTPAYGGTLNIMSFSSVGGLMVDDVNRLKPDFTAPNGVNTTVDLGNGDWDHNTDSEADTDILPNFFGTSAAAPHAAAVAALLLDAKSAYYDVAMLPAEVRTTLTSTAIGTETYDNVYGNGFIQADAALMQIANPAPIIYELNVISEGVPGLDAVLISVSGDYLTAETKLYFNGQELITTADPDFTTLQAEVPPFTELYPPITAFNPPKEGTNGKDGGMSNALYFTEKPTIVGTFTSTTKSYGENMPVESIFYEIVYFDGTTQLLEVSDLTSSQIERVYAIELQNNADALANAGIWPYFISLEEVLNPLYEGPSPTTPSTEDSLISNYNFIFNIGDLEIFKLDLTITPDDLSLDYGEAITGFSYSFDYNNTDISTENNAIIQDSLLLAYEGDMIADVTAIVDTAFYMDDGNGGLVPNSYFMSANAYDAAIENGQSLALVNGQSLALVNGQSLALVNGQSLALVNGQSLALVNGQSLALVNAAALVSGQSLALVNIEGITNGQSLALVNGQSLALVNDPPDWSPTMINAQSLALVNTEALTNAQSLALVNEGGGLVNGQSLALVNTVTFNDITNDDAIIILTVDDIITMNTENSGNTIELISINTISGNTVTGTNDPHKIAPGAFIASNFNVQYELGDLIINKATLEVTGASHVINEGTAAPEFTFTYDAFISPDDETSVFGSNDPFYSILNIDDNSPYDSVSSGPGEYVVEFPSAENYNIIFPVAINLFVNPDGNGTKSVVPKLDCVEDDGEGNFTAYYFYENKNDDPVWVMYGPDNLVSGDGDPDISQQPFKFESGGGTWEAYFDGSDMIWTVSSQDHGHKTSHAQQASSNSKNCNKSGETASLNDPTNQSVKYFPNPVTDKLHIEIGKSDIIKKVSLYYIYGKLVQIENQNISDKNIELDLSGLASGIYVVKIQLESTTETFKIIKQ